MSTVSSSIYPIVSGLRDAADHLQRSQFAMFENDKTKIKAGHVLWLHNVFHKIWENAGRPQSDNYGGRAFENNDFRPLAAKVNALNGGASDAEQVLTLLRGAIREYKSDESKGDKEVQKLIDFFDKSNPVLQNMRNLLFNRISDVALRLVSHKDFSTDALAGKNSFVGKIPDYSAAASYTFVADLVRSYKKMHEPYKNLSDIDLNRVPIVNKDQIAQEISRRAQEAIKKQDFGRSVFREKSQDTVVVLYGRTKQLILHEYYCELQGIPSNTMKLVPLPEYGVSDEEFARSAVGSAVVTVVGVTFVAASVATSIVSRLLFGR